MILARRKSFYNFFLNLKNLKFFFDLKVLATENLFNK